MTDLYSSRKQRTINGFKQDSDDIQKYRFTHHFLPHPYHKTRAKLLSSPMLILYTFILGGLIFATTVTTKYFPGVLGYASNITIQDLLDDTNKVRAENGLKPLTLNAKLSTAAEEKATDMFAHNYWAHESPTGLQPWDFILGADYDYTYAGENLAKNFNNSEDVVTAWFDSVSHRENLLNSNYDEIGFAVTNGTLDGYETTLVVQMFGKARTAGQPIAINDEAASSQKPKDILPSTDEVPNNSVDTNINLLNKPVVIVSKPLDTASKPLIDIPTATQLINLAFGVFLVTLLGLDIWYTRRHAIPKITGHTYVHIVFLLFAMVGVMFAISPGKIL